MGFMITGPMKIREYLAFQVIGLLLFLSASYLFLLTFSHYLVDDKKIFSTISQELQGGKFYQGRKKKPRLRSFLGSEGQRLLGADCRLMTLGLTRKGSNLLDAFNEAVRNPVLDDCTRKVLRYFSNTSPTETSRDYARYWHGFTVFTRPILAVGGYSLLTFLTTMCTILAFIVFLKILVRKLGFFPPLAFVLPLFLFPLELPLTTFSYQVTFLLGLLFFSATKFFLERAIPSRQLFLLFVFFGSLTSFMDKLVNPLFALIFPLLGFLLFLPREDPEETSLKKTFGSLAKLTAFWVIGYAGNWLIKIVINIAVLGEQEWIRFVEKAYRRTSSVTRWGKEIDRLEGLSRSFDHFVENFERGDYLLIWVLIVGSVAALIVFWKRMRPTHLGILGISTAPFFWYLVFTNHSFVHAMFTFYSFYVPLALISFVALLILVPEVKIWINGLTNLVPSKQKKD